MRIYKNTIEHRGWEDDINELAIYTTWPMTKHEFVEYYNKNIAGASTRNCEDYGVTHSIYRFDNGVDRFPWLEYILDADEDDHNLKFSDDRDEYRFMQCSFNIMGSGADGEKE